MNKKLIIIATPIGNINEISKRAIDAIESNEIFFCEDSRVTKKFLNLLNIDLNNKKFISLNSFNENKIVNEFNFTHDVYCLMSDAGYPILNDPGFYLINFFIKKNWNIEIINGPSSLLHALVVSGFKIQNFMFYGFLDHSKIKKEKELLKLKKEIRTIVIFESVHRIEETLLLINEIFGEKINLVVARELTKSHETIYRGNAENILKKLTYKGEFVILIDNNKIHEDTSLNDLLKEIKFLINKGEKDKIACKMIAYKYNKKTNELYKFWLSQKNNV